MARTNGRQLALTWLALLLAFGYGSTQTTPATAQSLTTQGQVAFEQPLLTHVPNVEPARDVPTEGLTAIYYEGLPYKGQPTQVFAYYGLPRKDEGTAKDGKVPGIVLVHGGGGTAFARWVKLWNDRGYAAIAMDLCGCVPVGSYGKWQRHARGGPPGWDASFEQIHEPLADQWQTHAVTAVARANSLLRSMPEVDADRVGLTGISWGAYDIAWWLALIHASSVQRRFMAVVTWVKTQPGCLPSNAWAKTQPGVG